MASASDRPDLEALNELEEVLRHLAEELAGWRRRALSAETRLAEQSRAVGGDGAEGRVKELDERNHALEQRLTLVRSRVTEILSRLKFLEQQERDGGPEDE